MGLPAILFPAWWGWPAPAPAPTPTQEQLNFYRALLVEPHTFVYEEEHKDASGSVVGREPKSSLWPTMADDPLYMVMKALQTAGAERGANRWFKCKNGHPYSIGQCGGAMETSKCMECGESIGGSDHKLDKSNEAIGKVDKAGDDHAGNRIFGKDILEDNSDRGYCLRGAGLCTPPRT